MARLRRLLADKKAGKRENEKNFDFEFVVLRFGFFQNGNLFCAD